MKVLHVISTMLTGGAQRLLVDIMPILSKEIEVTVLVNDLKQTSFEDALIQKCIRIETLGCKNIYSPVNIWKIRKYIKEFDVVHVHLFPSLYWVALASLGRNTPLVYTEHSTYNSRRNRRWLLPLERFIYGRYSKIISISELTQHNLQKWLGAKRDDERFVVVNNGVRLSDFQRKSSNKPYPKTLIMVSRFAAAKDQPTIIRAMPLLKKEVHLILVGDGPQLKLCKKLSLELNVGDRVHFVGHQSDVATWLKQADIGIQSSKWEGFGLTAVEMMASGLPVIATDVDGLKQVVEGAGEIFPVGDEIQLAKKVNHLFDDGAYYSDLKERCLERAASFDIETTAGKYLNVYRKVMSNEN